MVEVRFTGTASECREEMRALLGTGTAQVEKDTAKPISSAPKSEKSAKKETPQVETVSEPTVKTTQAPGERKIEDISAKVAELLSKHPRATVVEFLASFGVKKGSDLPAEKWNEFLTKADALK